MKIENVSVESIVEDEYLVVSPKDEIREVLNKIRKGGGFASCVMKEKKFIGTITWREILQKSVPPDMKVEGLVIHPPKIDAKSNVLDAAEKMLETGARAAPVFKEDKIIGLITQKEIIKVVGKDENFSRKKIESLFSKITTIHKNETIGKAKAIMRNEGVARLPVVDDNSRLVGSVDLSEIVKTFTAEQALQVGDKKGDVVPERDSPVTAVMNNNPLALNQETSLKKAAKKISRSGGFYVIAMDGDKPMGIVTPKDILEVVAARKKGEGAYVQIAGAKDLDSFDKEKILDIESRTVKKAGRMFKNVENLIVHIKRQNTEGGKTQYSTRARIFTSNGLFVAKQGWEWNLLEAVQGCLKKLEKQFTNYHEKKIDEKRKKGR